MIRKEIIECYVLSCENHRKIRPECKLKFCNKIVEFPRRTKDKRYRRKGL